MTPASASGAIQGVSAQFQAASLKIAEKTLTIQHLLVQEII